MNIEVLKSRGIDYDYGVKRFAGRASLYEKVLTKFLEDSTFSRLKDAYEAKDMEGLMASAHEFKGMCGNIGLTSLFEASDTIVQMLRQAAFEPDELTKAYCLLEETYISICGAVTEAMGETV